MRMKQPPRDSAHTTTLKIRLPETLRQQLLIDAAGKPFNRMIVERLEAGSGFSDVNLARVGPLMYSTSYDAVLTAVATRELRLARQYRDLSAAIRVLLKVGAMLAPESTLLRSARLRPGAHRFLEDARDKIRRALDIVLNLQQVMVDDAPTGAKAETGTAPFPDRPSGLLDRVYNALETRNELSGQSGRPPEERDPGNIVEVKIGLPEILRQRLAATASRNKRTLTAEIRARLELSCAIEIFKRRIGREMTLIVSAAAKTVSSLPLWRKALTTDELSSVIDALETAQAVLNPLSGYLRHIRSKSGPARELEDARNQIRTALDVVQRFSEALVEAEPAANLTAPLDTG